MNRESLSNTDWLRTVHRLGGAELLEEEAREFGAFQKARKVKCAVDHLRLVLAYCWSQYGLRWAAAWAEAMGLASLSNVAVLKRLRNSVEWLEQLVSRSLGAGAREAGLAAAKGRPVRLVDATSVAKAGRAAREKGGRWRIHSVFDLASERFTAFEVTDESEGEVIDRADVVPGEIRGRVEEGRGGLSLWQSLRLPSPLIEPDVRISRIRLSDWLHGRTRDRPVFVLP